MSFFNFWSLTKIFCLFIEKNNTNLNGWGKKKTKIQKYVTPLGVTFEPKPAEEGRVECRWRCVQGSGGSSAALKHSTRRQRLMSERVSSCGAGWSNLNVRVEQHLGALYIWSSADTLHMNRGKKYVFCGGQVVCFCFFAKGLRFFRCYWQTNGKTKSSCTDQSRQQTYNLASQTKLEELEPKLMFLQDPGRKMNLYIFSMQTHNGREVKPHRKIRGS